MRAYHFPIIFRWPFSTNIIGPLVAAGFRVVAMDCRGHGLSDKFYNSDDYGMKMVQGMKAIRFMLYVQNLATEYSGPNLISKTCTSFTCSK